MPSSPSRIVAAPGIRDGIRSVELPLLNGGTIDYVYACIGIISDGRKSAVFWTFGILAVTFFVTGVMLFMLGLRSKKGLALSQFWGVRTNRTMVNARTFAKANKAIWRCYIFQGCTSFIAGIMVLVTGIVNDEAYVFLVIVALSSALLIIASTVYGYFKAHRSIR